MTHTVLQHTVTLFKWWNGQSAQLQSTKCICQIIQGFSSDVSLQYLNTQMSQPRKQRSVSFKHIPQGFHSLH